MSLLKNAREAVEKLWRSGLQTVQEKRQQLAAGIAALQQEESAQFTDLAPVTEVIGNLQELVAAEARAVTESDLELIRDAGGRVDRTPGRPDVLIAPALPPEDARVVRDQLRAGAGPQAIVAGLTRRVHAAGAYAAGRPMRQRIPRLAEIPAEVAAFEREDAQIVDEAEMMGISLQHLEGERGRRIQLAQRLERERIDESLNAGMRRRERQRRGEGPA